MGSSRFNASAKVLSSPGLKMIGRSEKPECREEGSVTDGWSCKKNTDSSAVAVEEEDGPEVCVIVDGDDCSGSWISTLGAIISPGEGGVEGSGFAPLSDSVFGGILAALTLD
jgi:hypothetical protein